MPSPLRILVVEGPDAAEMRALLGRLAQAAPGLFTVLSATGPADLLIVGPHTAALLDEKPLKKLLRLLPYREGVLVAPGTEGRLRKAARGFQYRFRWYDGRRVWPGLRLERGTAEGLLATAAARAAHEAGASQESIKQALRLSD